MRPNGDPSRMPSPYAAAWSPRINFVIHGRKPAKYRLPGLEIVVHAKAAKLWRCCLDGLYSN
jgi:hypothetical protein